MLRRQAKQRIVAAVETTAEGKPVRLKLWRVTSFCATSISGFAKRSLDPSYSVVSDGLRCFGSVDPPNKFLMRRKPCSNPQATVEGTLSAAFA